MVLHRYCSVLSRRSRLFCLFAVLFIIILSFSQIDIVSVVIYCFSIIHLLLYCSVLNIIIIL